MPHTSCRRGTPVLVTLRSGEQFRDHFVDRLSRVVVFRDRGRVALRDIRSFSPTHAKSQTVRGADAQQAGQRS